jgi:proline iminopeptidase
MEPVAAMLDDVASVIRWDQRGCGRSSGDGPYTYARFIADLEIIRSHWNVQSWVVGGHSAGAGLALYYALEHPAATDAMLYISGTGLDWFSGPAEAYRQNREERLGALRPRWQELRDQSARNVDEERELSLLTFATDFGPAAECLKIATEWFDERFVVNRTCNQALAAEVDARGAWARPRLGRLACPVLVVHGENDPRPLDGPAAVAAAAPRGTLVVLPGTGHLPWAESPTHLACALREFLAQLS